MTVTLLDRVSEWRTYPDLPISDLGVKDLALQARFTFFGLATQPVVMAPMSFQTLLLCLQGGHVFASHTLTHSYVEIVVKNEEIYDWDG